MTNNNNDAQLRLASVTIGDIDAKNEILKQHSDGAATFMNGFFIPKNYDQAAVDAGHIMYVLSESWVTEACLWYDQTSWRAPSCVTMLGAPNTSSMAFAAPKSPELTPMQLQAIQQREFEAAKPVVFASVVDVLQDLGFTIGSADLTTGFISAESPTASTKNAGDFLWYGGATGNTRVTAFIEQMASGKTKLRLNFVARKTRANTWTNQQENHDTAVMDGRVYQATFEKVDEALFVRRAVNTPAPSVAATPTATPN